MIDVTSCWLFMHFKRTEMYIRPWRRTNDMFIRWNSDVHVEDVCLLMIMFQVEMPCQVTDLIYNSRISCCPVYITIIFSHLYFPFLSRFVNVNTKYTKWHLIVGFILPSDFSYHPNSRNNLIHIRSKLKPVYMRRSCMSYKRAKQNTKTSWGKNI